MKRHLHFYRWLLCLQLFVVSSAVAYSQGKVTNLDELKAGSVIKIYPYGHYNESSLALACSRSKEYLTSYAKAGDGDEWTLIDAGGGYYYLKNELGYYWAYQDESNSHSLGCVLAANAAVKVKLTWDSENGGICFWNQKTDRGLNNLYSYNYQYNWYSSSSDYDNDTNSTFDVYSSYGSGEDIVQNGIKYRLDNKNMTAQVCANNYQGNVAIPQTVSYKGKEYQVTSLASRCFKDCSGLTGVSLPDGIISLGAYCFDGCSGLMSISLPNSVTSLGTCCFQGCSGLTVIYLSDGITSLEGSCFRDCIRLKHVKLPKNVTSLGGACFYNCSDLINIVLPNSITSIGNACFYNCSSLPSITLPNGITCVNASCFSGCSNLSNITLPNSVTSLEIACFSDCSSLKNVTLPNGIKEIGIRCFAYCSSLESITLPNSVKELGESCFVGCSSLTSVTLPSSVTKLRANCFYGCSSLTSIALTNSDTDFMGTSVIYLEDRCFDNRYLKKLLLSSKTPPTTSSSSLEMSNITLYVPKDASNSYKEKSPWKDAKEIIERGALVSMDFGQPNASVVKTETCKLSLNIKPLEAEYYSVWWSSDDNSVATVVQNGNYPLEAIVTAHKVGKATITAMARDGSGITATCEVEVTPLLVNGIEPITTGVVKTIPTKLEANVLPVEADNKRLLWTCLTPAIATITEEGIITGLKMGTAKVQATAMDGSKFSKTFDVEIKSLPVSSISLPKESSIMKTESRKLEYMVSPTAADNQNLIWNSNQVDIASVDESTGLITAHKVGDAIITATATDGSGVSASTTIHVTPLKVSNIEMPKEMKVLRTTTTTIEAKISPVLADDKKLSWASEDKSIATVNQDGDVKGLKVGTTKITATTTDGSVSASCKVTVTDATIKLSTMTIKLRKTDTYTEQAVAIEPENIEHKDVVWSTSGNGVASVDKDGNVTGNKPGIDTLRCSLVYASGIYSECRVIVYDENVVYIGGLYYLLHDDGTATVTGIYGAKGNGLDASKVAQYYSGTINIPRSVTYNGVTYDVTNVGSYSFACQNDLQSVFIPTSVKAIEQFASTKAEKLQMVNVEEDSQLINIGNSAFKECTGLRFFTFEGTTNKMKSIDASAFYGCSKLEQIKWVGKSTLTTIGDYAFYKCASLNNLMMPNSVLSVGNYSFRYCSGLTDVSLSSTLSIIYEYAFGECGFSHITLPESLVSVQAGSFINNEHLQEITIPERMEGIGSAAFENNSSLETVTFRTEINTMTIGDNAFNLCPVLSKVNISHLNSWAHTNFQNAKANPANTSHNIYMNGVEIIDVVLPEGTRYVNNNAFNGCSHIKSLSMPKTIDRINDNIIYGCSALKDVYCYAEDVPVFIGTHDPADMDDVFKSTTLHVLYGKESAYKADSWWGRFAKVDGCDEPQVEPVKVSSITISQTSATLKVDDTIQLTATAYPTDADNRKIKWYSSNEDVAMVTDEGFVLAIAEGTSDITAEATDGSGVKAICQVKVEKKQGPAVIITQLEFESSAVTIEQGKPVQLLVKYYPENATNKQLNWTSAKPSVATVDENGVVTGVGEGKTIISAKTTDGSNLTINCVVTVVPATGIGNISMGDVKLLVKNRHLQVIGLADNDAIKVVNAIGYTVYEGTEHEVNLQSAGIYIVKVKGKTLKISVK